MVIPVDYHANWASDLTWLDEHAYDLTTGNGSIGVEFAGTAVSSPLPHGQNITLAPTNNASKYLVRYNGELQWSEFYYRGYFELQIGHESVEANYFGTPTTVYRNLDETSPANLTMLNGVNALPRDASPGGGIVENGALKAGQDSADQFEQEFCDRGVLHVG